MRNIFFALGTIILLAIFIAILPIDKINWGRISILPAATITVTGTSEGNIANSQASFGATVSSTNANKQTAVSDVNTKMTALIKSLKDFGIADADIKTDNVNVYQMPVSPVPVPQTGANGAQTLIYPVPPVGTSGSGDWQASNSITITLKDVSKYSALSDILNNSGATSVYGPNLAPSLNTSASDADLLAKAVADAKSKADVIAKAGGQTVGKMINVQESGSNYPMPMMFSAKDTASSGSPIQPGTSSLSKSVTVVYELK
jgi:uncharacterized protein